MASGKAVAALGLALILCVFLAACGGGSKPAPARSPVIFESSLPSGAVNVPYSATVHVSQWDRNVAFHVEHHVREFARRIELGQRHRGNHWDPDHDCECHLHRAGNGRKVAHREQEPEHQHPRRGIDHAPHAAGRHGGHPLHRHRDCDRRSTALYVERQQRFSAGGTHAHRECPMATATISGTPTTLGTSTFTIQVADAESPPATGTSGSLSISIEGFVTITNTSLPDGNVAIFYDSQLIATGGLAPYTWSLTSGTLPPGLSLTPATGVISGTPTTTGSYPITVQVVDSESTPATATGMFTITINPTPQLQVTTSSLPAGTQGVRYSNPLAATGGVPPYSWSLTAGTVARGLDAERHRHNFGNAHRTQRRLPHHRAGDRHPGEYGLIFRLDADHQFRSLGDYDRQRCPRAHSRCPTAPP